LLQLAKTVGNQAFSRLIQTRDQHPAGGGTGQQLDGATRARMESSFGADFSGVVVHADAEAGSAARALDARAFALGNHIVFDPGEYVPGSVLGDMLIAHELAHVQQQAAGLSSASPDDARLEADANVAAARAITGKTGAAKGGLTGLARDAGPTLKRGLLPQRCPVSAQKMNTPAFFGARSRATMERLNDIAQNGASLSNWIRFGSAIVAFEDPISAFDSPEAQEALNSVPTIVRASMKQEVEFLIVEDATGHFLNDQERRFWERMDSRL